jgi:RNA recognition motif-containing protein
MFQEAQYRSMEVSVDNLPHGKMWKEVKDLFRKEGNETPVACCSSNYVYLFKGFYFSVSNQLYVNIEYPKDRKECTILFYNPNHAHVAVEKMDGYMWGRSKLVVKVSICICYWEISLRNVHFSD